MKLHKNFITSFVLGITTTLMSYFSAITLGKIINNLHNNDFNFYIYSLQYFVFVSSSAVSSICLSTSLQRYKIDNQLRAWSEHLPMRGSKTLMDMSDSFYLFCMDTLPKKFELKLLFYLNLSKSFLILGLILFTAVQSKIPFVIPVLAAFASMTYFSNFGFKKSIQSLQRSLIEKKNSLIHWTDNYFKLEDLPYFNSFRECKSNFIKLRDMAVKPYERDSQKLLKTNFFKNIIQVSLTDVPLYLVIIYFLYLTSKNYISHGQLVTWIFLLQLMTQANNSTRSALEAKVELLSLSHSIDKIKQSLNTSSADAFKPHTNPKAFTLNVTFRDMSKLILENKAGIYHVQGSNGTGKSTLLRELRNQKNSNYFNIPDNDASKILQYPIRIWNSALYDLGDSDPLRNFLLDHENLSTTLYTLLSKETAKSWEQNFQSLFKNKKLRPWNTLSSGERSYYNFARIINEIKDNTIIMIDEGDVFFDSLNKSLFNNTLSDLSKWFPIYLIQHKHKSHEVVVNSYFWGCNDQLNKAWGVPFSLRLICDSKGDRIGLGNLGEMLVPELKRVLDIMQNHCDYPLSKESFILESEVPGIKIGNTASAQLSLATALFQIQYQKLGAEHNTRIAATGKILLDGTIESVAGLEAKKSAASKLIGKDVSFISPENLSHISKLSRVMGSK